MFLTSFFFCNPAFSPFTHSQKPTGYMVLCANYKISFTGNTLKLRVSTGDQLDAAVVTFFFLPPVYTNSLENNQKKEREPASVSFY